MSDHTKTTPALGKLLTIREPKLDYARRFKPGDTLAGVVMPLVAEIDAQRREVARLTEDRERIEWLERLGKRKGPYVLRVLPSVGAWALFNTDVLDDAKPTVREAIDAARREETQG
jgi:hypothetical protein